MVDPGFTKRGGGGGGGHKMLDLLSLLPHIYKINKTTRWEVVKNSASPKRPFFFKFFFKLRVIYLRPTSNPKGGGAHSTCIFIFLLGHAHISPKGGGGHVPEMPPPPLDPPMQLIIGRVQ